MASKSKSPDKRPAKTKYWSNKILQKHKVSHILKNMKGKMSEKQAIEFWKKARTTRIKTTK